MIVYCMGERALIEKEFAAAGERRESLNLNDDEVLFTSVSDGKRYAATGEIPFGNMTILEYVSYNRSTALGRRIRDEETRYYARLFGVKLGLNRRLKSLDPVDFRRYSFSRPTTWRCAKRFCGSIRSGFPARRARKCSR